MKATIIKFYEYMTTMGDGAYVRLNIDGLEIDAFLAAKSGVFCPYTHDPKEQSLEGTTLNLVESIRDNCDRNVFETNITDDIGIRQAELEFSGGGKMEKIIVGEIEKFMDDGEIEIRADKITASFSTQFTEGLHLGDRVKVVGDLVFHIQ
ncbi:MAG: hypothetical protein NTX25_23905 [Proteobacteria bacterium]|nr:hypothetical protein [Pseudomonadota bacterium]